MKVLIETYGCQMNTADSELIQGILKEGGFGVAHCLDEADVIMLNTCAIREKAEARIMGRLTNLLPYKRKKDALLIGVVGCMAKHLGVRIIEKMPFVDFVIGPDNYRDLAQTIRDKRHQAVVKTAFDKSECYLGFRPRRAKGVTAWVTIQRGCNYVCSYCIVPFVRGGERNIPAAEIIKEVEALVAEGASIITLLGQTVNSYIDGDINFPKLIKMVAKVDGVDQIRFTSPHPLGFSDELIETIAYEEKVAKFVHLPMQSASNTQLERMRRLYTFEEYSDIVRKLRMHCPEIAISTDVIVGFSGETEEDYEKTKQALIDLRFAFAFLFAYSERSLAIAAKKLEDDVPAEVKQRRVAEVIAIQQQISKEIYCERVGTTVEVIIEGVSRKNPEQVIGNTRDFKTTIFEPGDAKAGDWVEVEITAATSQTLVGRLKRIVKRGRNPNVEEQIAAGISLGPT